MNDRLLLVSIFLFLASCSSQRVKVDYEMPATYFVIPETSGGLTHGRGEVGWQSTDEIQVAESYQSSFLGSTSETSIDTNKAANADNGPSIGLDIGILSRIDLIGKITADSASAAGLNLMVFGSPTSEGTRGFRLSIGGLAGLGEDDENAEFTLNSDEEGQSEFDNTSGRVEYTMWSLFLATGYRFNEKILLYLSGYRQQFSADAELTINNVVRTFDAKTEMDSVNLGAYLSTGKGLNVFFKVEGGYHWTDVNEGRNRNGRSLFIGAGIGI